MKIAVRYYTRSGNTKKLAEAVFAKGGISENMPTTSIPNLVGMGILDVIAEAGIVASKGEGRRLITQNGLSVNDKKVTDVNMTVTEDMIVDGSMIIKKGKKVFHRVTL